jgi:hypothetical protein
MPFRRPAGSGVSYGNQFPFMLGRTMFSPLIFAREQMKVPMDLWIWTQITGFV